MKQKITTILFFVLINTVLFGQNFKNEFYTQLGSENGLWRLNKLAIDSKDNFYVVGYGGTSLDLDPGSGEYILPEHNYRDIFIAKYTSENELISVIYLDASYRGEILSIDIDKNDNVYVAGRLNGSINFDFNNSNFKLARYSGGNAFVAKYNSEGKFVWAKQFGNNIGNCSSRQIKYRNNKIFVLISLYGKVKLDPNDDTFVLGDQYGTDAILELDDNGDFLWANNYNGFTHLNSIEVFNDEIYTYGTFYKKCNFDFKGTYELESKGESDGFLVKYNANHDLLWAKSYGSEKGYDFIKSFRKFNNTISILVGITSSGTIGSTSSENGGYYLLELSDLGDEISLKKILDIGKFYIRNLVYDSREDIYLACYVNDTIDIDVSDNDFIIEPISSKGNVFILTFDTTKSISTADMIKFGDTQSFIMAMDSKDALYMGFDFDSNNNEIFAGEKQIDAIGSNDILYQKVIRCETVQSSINASGCDSIEINGYSYYESGIYTQNLVNSLGCDSILTIDLNLGKSNIEYIHKEVCDSFKLNEEIYYDSGNYTQILTNHEGCDSLISLELVVNKTSTNLINKVACDSFKLNNILYKETGVFTQNLINSKGCDSIITLDLEIINIDLLVTTKGDTLIANEKNANSYTWIDCKTNKAIENANNRIFIPSKSGSYSVQLIKNGCEKMSECVNIILSNIEKVEKYISIKIFPNPSTNKVFISGLLKERRYNISVLNLEGKKVKSSFVVEDKEIEILDMNKLEKGVYFVLIKNKEFTKMIKIIKM